MKKFLLSFSAIFSATFATAQIYDTLPVIMHVIHYSTEAVGTGRNLSQAQVYSQFDVLNEDFRMANPDIVNTPAPFLAVAGDMGLNFAKALVDPQGNPLAEPGIDRVDITSLGLSNTPPSITTTQNIIQPQTIWDPSQYLNVWVVDIPTSAGIMGWATSPANTGMGCIPATSPDSLRDGIVIDYMCCGRIGTIYPAPFNKGRTLDYFLSRWLGLQKVDNLNCVDDCVADTPPSDGYTLGCPSFPLFQATCNGANGAMYCNFMTFTDDSCRTMFTQGQKLRVDSVLTNGYYQSQLRLSNTATAIREIPVSFNCRLFPNPANNATTLSLPMIMSGDVAICDVSGRLVYTAAFSNVRQLELGLVNFEAGVYAVSVVSKDGKISHTKLVVE